MPFWIIQSVGPVVPRVVVREVDGLPQVGPLLPGAVHLTQLW